MENAVDALKMAAAVLIFVIAIGSSFSLFGTAKHTADSIITMRDKQLYLEAAELDGGILYTSSSKISEDQDVASAAGVTSNGDRIVNIEDVISTIYGYSKEKYGVTIMEDDGSIIARYDSNTDQIMSLWNSITNGKDDYIQKLKTNTKTDYLPEGVEPKFSKEILKKLYKITTKSGSITYGAPWYGNDEQIRKRIACDIKKDGTYEYNNQSYSGIDLLDKLKNNTIVEVTNEIDNSTYLKDGEETTDLLQQYEMPTIEIVYIIIQL